MPSYENQGEKTSVVFAGKGKSSASQRIYAESAELFAALIADSLSPERGPHVLADIGSFKGELMDEILERLRGHAFHTVAVDINRQALDENRADRKIVADVADTLLEDKAIDVAICRYVLQWNPPDKQRQILRELDRITKRAVILQHFGCDDRDLAHRARVDEVLSGLHIPKLLRKDYYLSSAREIEAWLTQAGLPFIRQSHVKVENLSDSFIDRYNLGRIEARKLKDILGAYDYIILTTWTLAPV